MTPIPMPMLLLTPMEDISSIFSLGHSVEFLMDTVVCGLVLLTMATMAMLMLRRWECITTEHRKPRRVTMYLLFSREWPVETRKEIYHQFCKSRLFRIHFLINSQFSRIDDYVDHWAFVDARYWTPAIVRILHQYPNNRAKVNTQIRGREFHCRIFECFKKTILKICNSKGPQTTHVT